MQHEAFIHLASKIKISLERLSKALAIFLLLASTPLWGHAESPNKPLAFITNQGEDSVDVVDLEREQILYKLAVGKDPAGVAISYDQT